MLFSRLFLGFVLAAGCAFADASLSISISIQPMLEPSPTDCQAYAAGSGGTISAGCEVPEASAFAEAHASFTQFDGGGDFGAYNPETENNNGIELALYTQDSLS